MRSFNRVMCSLGGQEEYERKIKNALPVSPQDDHVIEFAKQFGWDSKWMEKQPKKKGKKKELEEEAARQSQAVGDMLGAVSRDSSRDASASQVVPHDQSSSGVVFSTEAQAPQVKAPPPVKATPPASPMVPLSSVVPVADASQSTPPAFATPPPPPPPPPRRRRARSEESAVGCNSQARQWQRLLNVIHMNHMMWRLMALRMAKLVSSRLASSASKSVIHRMVSIPWRHFLVL